MVYTKDNKISLPVWGEAIFYSIVVMLMAHWNQAFSHFTIYGDVSLMYYVEKLFHPELFPGDPYGDFMVSKPFLRVMSLILFFPCKYFSLIKIIKIINILVTVLFFILLFIWGKKHQNILLSRVLTLLGVFLFLPMDSFYGVPLRGIGLILSLGVLLLSSVNLFFFCFIGSHVLILFYPQLFPSVFLFMIFEAIRNRKRTSFYLLFFMTSILLVEGLYVINLYLTNETVMYQVHQYGAYKMDVIKEGKWLFVLSLLNLDEHVYIFTWVLSFYFLFILISLKNRAEVFCHVPKGVYVFLLAHFLSAILLKIFIPGMIYSRQMIFALPLSIFIIASLVGYDLLKDRKAACLKFLPFFAVLYVFFPNHNDLNSYKKYESLFHELQSLPSNSLLAGYPESVHLIPLYTRKMTFLPQRPSVYMFSKNIYDLYKQRADDLEEAFLSLSKEPVLDFSKKYGITHFILEKELLLRGMEKGVNDKKAEALGKPLVKPWLVHFCEKRKGSENKPILISVDELGT